MFKCSYDKMIYYIVYSLRRNSGFFAARSYWQCAALIELCFSLLPFFFNFGFLFSVQKETQKVNWPLAKMSLILSWLTAVCANHKFKRFFWRGKNGIRKSAACYRGYSLLGKFCGSKWTTKSVKFHIGRTNQGTKVINKLASLICKTAIKPVNWLD